MDAAIRGVRVFLGYDPREALAFHVAAHSIIRRTRAVVSFTAVGNTTLPQDIWWRERGPHDSTEFSNARFLVPYLCGFEGWAVYADCDTLWLTDICDLIDAADPDKAVLVRKHQHIPKDSTKFLDQEQSRYGRKNWSSLMLFNCDRCRKLTPEYVNSAPGLDLHQFAWTQEIGEIGHEWNVLVESNEQRTQVA